MLKICNTCGNTYHSSDPHQCCCCGYGKYVPMDKEHKKSHYEIEARTRVVNNLNKLRSLSQNCQYMIPAMCGLVAEIQADINILWGRNGY